MPSHKSQDLYYCHVKTWNGKRLSSIHAADSSYDMELAAVFGAEAVFKKKLSFASPTIKQSLAYAFDPEDEIFLSYTARIDERLTQIAFICNSSESMNKYRQIEIYEVSSKNFKAIAPDIWVSDKKPRLNHMPVNMMLFDETVMDMGLQIFSVKENMKEVQASGLKEFVKDCSPQKDFIAQIGEMVRRGIVTWENLSNDTFDVMLAKEMGFKANTKKVTIDFKK